MIQEVLAESFSSYKLASFLGSFLFADIHLPHHDIFLFGPGFFSILIPLAIWFIMMFLVSILFIFARVKSGSIFGAIACNSGYILGMSLFVYHFLLL
ncbi:MAG: CPBP family intramembrane metalloprotease [Tindallia sp. MSAO_Bac2]|nr:MAG: CPBP family intramembrane metalloprotease [Tindallia sp. MSAO_Bac2]